MAALDNKLVVVVVGVEHITIFIFIFLVSYWPISISVKNKFMIFFHFSVSRCYRCHIKNCVCVVLLCSSSTMYIVIALSWTSFGICNSFHYNNNMQCVCWLLTLYIIHLHYSASSQQHCTVRLKIKRATTYKRQQQCGSFLDAARKSRVKRRRQSGGRMVKKFKIYRFSSTSARRAMSVCSGTVQCCSCYHISWLSEKTRISARTMTQGGMI